MQKPTEYAESLEYIDALVIGGGVVGAAIAQRLASSGRSVVVLEKFDRIAEGVTSRNSGVIHSGIYYPPKSLKAKLCIRGQRLLYAWAARHSVPHLKMGKLIVSTSPGEDETLEEIWKNAVDSGAPALSRWPASRVAAELPHTSPTGAIFAADTGIVDAYAFTRSLLDDAEANGAVVLTRAEATAIRRESDGYAVESSRGEVHARSVFNAAGLYADDVARLAGIDRYRIYPCRGDYFRLRASPGQYRHLIYPVKAKNAPGLGIHLTLDLGGGARLGPDTEFVASKGDFSSLQGKHFDDKRETFRVAAEKLLGPLKIEDLSFDQCGLRPKLRAPYESSEKDFVIAADLPNFVNLVGIESPGLTSAMAIAEEAEKLVSL